MMNRLHVLDKFVFFYAIIDHQKGKKYNTHVTQYILAVFLLFMLNNDLKGHKFTKKVSSSKIYKCLSIYYTLEINYLLPFFWQDCFERLNFADLTLVTI